MANMVEALRAISGTGTGYNVTGSPYLLDGTNPMATAAANTPAPTSTAAADNWIMPNGIDLRTAGTQSINGAGGTNQTQGNSGADKFDWGFNPDSINLVLGGLKTLADVWQAWSNNKLAKQQLAMSQKATNANLAAQRMAYNTNLEDRTRHRASYSRLSDDYVSKYLDSHRLEKMTV